MKKIIIEKTSEVKITRKQAIQKVGITALTTASLLFLQTKAHAANSVDTVNTAASPGSEREQRPAPPQP